MAKQIRKFLTVISRSRSTKYLQKLEMSTIQYLSVIILLTMVSNRVDRASFDIFQRLVLKFVLLAGSQHTRFVQLVS